MFFPSLNGELQAIYRGRHRYYFAPNHFYPQAYGMACFRGAPFLPKFSQMLRWMTEGGLVLHWRREVMFEESISTPSTFQGHTEQRWSTAINLKHCQAAFFLLLLGLAVGAVALVGEVTLASYITSRHGFSTP
ncbi:uncharacterized protein LOC123507887 [Portunus trituberculatus]|uniref:uncharacterized protein LOC123507887 n=1 Tax=Portunus trituberculatus TaxID=210409 RepID=UPI001E1CF53D|nr:uncharacterized protein LOC123507887 [Portunus trituberculatus]